MSCYCNLPAKSYTCLTTDTNFIDAPKQKMIGTLKIKNGYHKV